MKHNLISLGLAASLAALVPTAATAQVRLQTSPGIGVAVYGAFDFQRMTAAESFEAVLGKPTMIGVGGGVEVLRLFGDLFARVGVSVSRATGTRVLIVDDDVIEFDPPIALEVTAMPIELAAGWRFTPRARPGRPASRLTPYVGGGLLLMRYREATEFDQDDEGQFASFSGYLAFAGFDFPIAGPLAFGAEVQYRTVPGALGEGGVSAHFGDTDLGGLVFRVMVGFRK
jgi:opacity protein-like surface antigen